MYDETWVLKMTKHTGLIQNVSHRDRRHRCQLCGSTILEVALLSGSMLCWDEAFGDWIIFND